MNKDDKILSVITNFGCHWRCPYCVVKNNNLNFPKTTINDLYDLEKNYLRNYNKDIISVSGGGDPLWNYSKNSYTIKWYDLLFNALHNLEIKLELHTSIWDDLLFPYQKCYRVCFHIQDAVEMFAIDTRYGDLIENIRFVFVVDNRYDEYDIEHIANCLKTLNSQVNNKTKYELSFRQMIDKNYKTKYYLHDYLKQYHKDKWWYIEQDDYNDYYVHGKIYHSYKNITNDN